MHIFNRHTDVLTVGWVVGQLAQTVQPYIEGLTGSFVVKATYRLRPDDLPEPWPEEPLLVSGDKPTPDDPENSLDYASDFVPYKPHADFAVVGTAHRPAVGQNSVFPVSVTAGPIRKELIVFGPRKWVPRMFSDRALPGDPGPAESVPLRYTLAWGGHDSELNPVGLGPESAEVARIEHGPFDTRRDYRTDPEPAAFGPIPADFPFRQSRVGTYADDWENTRWPWLPFDFDWAYYNATAPDQWFEGYLRGDEPLQFDNMHPEHPAYRSRLPGVKPRLFLQQLVRLKHEELAFREVPLDLDTLWVDMDKEQLVLVWRGRAPVLSTKLKDVKNLLVLLEPLDQPSQPLADYEAIMAQHISPAPPPPAEPPPSPEQVLAELEARLAAAEAQAEQQARAQRERDADMALVQKILAAVQPAVDQNLESLQAFAKASGVELPSEPPSIKEALDLAKAQMRAQVGTMKAIPGAPADKIAEYEAMVAQFEAFEMPELPPDPEPKPVVEPEPFSLERARRGEYVNADLQGLDFSGLDLSGLDFTGATFAGAKFVGTILKGTILRGADLTNTDLSSARLQTAILDSADLGGCVAPGASFAGASLAAARLADLDLGGSDFSQATGMGADFSGSRLTGALFVEAQLPRAIFSGAVVEHADFSRARLAAATFAAAKAAAANFADADLTNFRAPDKADFRGTVFDRVKASGSLWRESVFDGASFARADLSGALFEDASLAATVFDRCDLSKAEFDDASLPGAVLTNANLRMVNFAGADLANARLDGSNLYEAAFRDTVLDGATWRDAIITNTRLALP